MDQLTSNFSQISLKTTETKPHSYIKIPTSTSTFGLIQIYSSNMDIGLDFQSGVQMKLQKLLKKLFHKDELYYEIKKHISKHHNSSLKVDEQQKACTPNRNQIVQVKQVRKVQQKPQGKQNQLSQKKKLSKKISIFLQSQEMQAQQQFNPFFSKQSVRSIKEIIISQIQLNQTNLKRIFNDTSPYLIVLSLCLFVKYYINYEKTIRSQQTGWILCISTIVAFKLLYDESIEGIADHFAQILKSSRNNVIDLQRGFCQRLNYALTISNQDFAFISNKLKNIEVYA